VCAFIRRYLDPAGRLGEVLFGLIMALGFTGAVRLGLDEADNRALFVGILGCNLAWAIVDGVMYVLGELFERGRKARLFREVASTTNEDAALEVIAAELDGPLLEITTERERDQMHRWVLRVLRRESPSIPRLRVEDVLGGVAVAAIIVVATFPVVLPYLVVADADLAVNASHAIALAMLFFLGIRWGTIVGGNALGIATSLTLVGAALVLVTIALGG
jgi:hypothetical protein